MTYIKKNNNKPELELTDDDRDELGDVFPLIETLLHIERTFAKHFLEPGSLNSGGQGYSPNKVHHLLIRYL